MRRLSSFAFVLTFAILGFVGCSSGGGPQVPGTTIYAQETVSGVTQAWSNALIDAYAIPPFFCDPTSDSNCLTNIGGQTNTSGIFNLISDNLPANWDIGVRADSTCSQGADSGIVALSVGGSTTVTCAQSNGSNVSVSPAGCAQITTFGANGKITVTNNCPTNITLTATAPVFSTAHAMALSGYSDTGSELYSQSPTATTTTKIVIPTPANQGDNVLLVTDPTTNQLVGAGLFIHNYSTVGKP
jgi:hypothetical protein